MFDALILIIKERDKIRLVNVDVPILICDSRIRKSIGFNNYSILLGHINEVWIT